MWLDPETDRALLEGTWADVVDIDAETLDVIVEAASDACVAYAPPLAEGATVPRRYKLAVILQARHIWTSLHGGDAQTIGLDGEPISAATWPLVLQSRDLLRPMTNPLARLVGARS